MFRVRAWIVHCMRSCDDPGTQKSSIIEETSLVGGFRRKAFFVRSNDIVQLE